MKNRTTLSKLVAVFCATVLLVNSVEFSAFTSAAADTSSTTGAVKEDIAEYTILGVEDFTGQDAITYTDESTSVKPSAGDKSLDGMLVDGIYQFSGEAALYIGAANWGGFRIGRKGTNDVMTYQFMNNAGAEVLHYKEITADDTGCTLFGEDVRIKVGVSFVKTYEDTAVVDAKIVLNIGETHEDIFVLEGIQKNHLIGRMFAHTNGGAITMKAANRQELLDFSDFGVTEDYTVTEGTVYKSAGSGTLKDVTIDGTYHLSGYPSITFGERAGMRLQIHVNGNKALACQFLDSSQVSHTPTTGGVHTTTSLGCNYLNTDVRIKVGFSFANVDETAGTADITIKLQIGPTWTDTIQITGATNIDRLTRTIWLTGTTSDTPNSSITLKAPKPEGVEMTPVDMGITDGVYGYIEGVKPEEDKKELGIEDFLDGVTQKNWTVGSREVITAGTGNLDGVVINGIYSIARYGQVQIGTASGNSGYRLQIRAMNNQTDLRIVFHDKNGIDYGLEDIPYSRIGYGQGTEIPIRVEFTYENKSNSTGLADVKIKVNIGEAIEKNITVYQIPMNELTRSMYVQADGVVTLKAVSKVKNNLGISDFIGGATQKNWTVGSREVITAGTGNLDGVVINGIYSIARYGQVQIGTASGNSGYRLQIRAMNNQTDLRIVFHDKNGIDYGLEDIPYSKIGYGQGTDIPIRVEFTYENKNDTTGLADVAIEVNIGELIERTITVPQIPMNQLTRSIYVHAADGAVTLKAAPEEPEQDTEEPVVEPEIGEFQGGKLRNLHTASTGKMSLNNKMFSAIVQFDGTDSELRIGGNGNNIWNGVCFRRVNDSYFAFGNTFGMGETLIPVEEVGLNSTSDKFNLKIQFEYVALDADQIANDMQYGIWINGFFVNQSYFYSEDDADKFGVYTLIYCPHELGKIFVSTEEHQKPDDNTPYILEDFNVKDQVYSVDNLPGRSYTKELDAAVTGSTSISGKVALKGDASMTLYGAPENEWFGLRFRMGTDGLTIQQTESNVDAISISVPDVEAGESFTFSVEQDIVDLDSDGEQDDVRFGVRVNGTLCQQQRFFLLDFAGRTEAKVLLYVGTKDANTSWIDVKPSVSVEPYDLDATDNGYLVSGKGTVTVNNAEAANGTILDTPGDYIVRCAEEGAYVKRVALYRSGDAYADGLSDARDLVAAVKAQLKVELDTHAGQKAADVDNNNIVNQSDTESIRDHLVGEKVLNAEDASYDVYGVEDFTNTSEYTLAYTSSRYQYTFAPDCVGTLDGVMIDGIYWFSGNSSINFGGTAWQGLQFSRVGTDTMRYQVVGANNAVDVTSSDTSCALFDEEVRIKVGFTYLSENETAGTVDVEVKVCIGSNYENTITAYGVNADYLKKAIYLYAQDNSTYTESKITLKEVPMTSGKVNYLTYEEGVMPIIGGSYAPYRYESYDYITDDIYRLIKDVGINLIVAANGDGNTNYAKNPQDVKDSLALAEKYGIGMYVFDTRYGNSELSASELANYQKDFMQFSSFKGVYVVDEPFTEANQYYTQRPDKPQMVDYVKKGLVLNSYSNTLGFINSGPRATISSMLYREHIYGILESKQKMISWDCYPFDAVSGGAWYGTPTNYFKNLSSARAIAYAEGKPFWGHIQAGSYWENSNSLTAENTTPSEAELLWNVNTSLAYGVKGIQYFPMIQPRSFVSEQYEANSLIGVDGKPTKWYYYAQTANKQIAAVDEYLLYANSLDVLAIGSTAQTHAGITKTSYGNMLTSVTASGGAIVGVFDYQGKTALYVVNYDAYDAETRYDALDQGDAAADEIKLTFGSKQNYEIVSTQLAVDVTSGSGTTCTLSLNNGGAALVILD